MKLYETLGVAPTATQADIKVAYRKKSKDAHPDREGGSTEAMAAINDAYAVLGDPERRAKYDATGDTMEAPKPPTLDEEGAKALAEVFADCLTKDGDITKVVRNAFTQGIGDARTEHITLGQLMRKLEKRRGLIVTVKGDNIYQMLLEGKIADVERKREHLLHQIAVGEAALALLADYRFTGEMETPVKRPFKEQFIAHPLLNSQYIEELMRANNGAFISGGFDFGRGA